MHKYAILRVYAALLFLLASSACSPTHSDLIGAIERYYQRSNRMAGAGNFRVTSITVIEHNRDANMVLAEVEGTYQNNALPNPANPVSSTEPIWFLYKEKGSQVEVIKIASPDEVESELLQKF